ncbi:MAG TPA: hypothetical protein VGD50_02625, partial [Candidatus Baltobacteraceae bacterium]
MLMMQAEVLASQIPGDGGAYRVDHEVAWELVGEGWLALGEAAAVTRALSQLGIGESRTRLLVSFARWAAEHPGDPDGSEALTRIVQEAPELAHWLTRDDYGKLAPAVFRNNGFDEAMGMIEAVSDPFTRTMMFVGICRVAPRSDCKVLLAAAEAHALTVREGDRDSALHWVVGGYARAGFLEDARRVHRARSEDSAARYADEDDWGADDEPLFAADDDSVLDFEPSIAESLEPVSPLRRCLSYGINDLKIRWLLDRSKDGDLDDPEAEELLASESFRRLEKPRQPSIHSDPTALPIAEFAAFFFDRPSVAMRTTHWDAVMLNDRHSCGGILIAARAVELFRNFAGLTSQYTAKQIDQGLWLLTSYPFGLLEEVFFSSEISDALAIDCLHAMTELYRDYYATVADKFDGTVFFMLWDSLR